MSKPSGSACIHVMMTRAEAVVVSEALRAWQTGSARKWEQVERVADRIAQRLTEQEQAHARSEAP